MLPVTTLEWEGTLDFTALAFSRSGDQLVALAGLPEPTILVWSLATGELLASGPLLVPSDSVSAEPSGSGSMCTLAPKRLLVWSLKLVYKTYLLESTEVRRRALRSAEPSPPSPARPRRLVLRLPTARTCFASRARLSAHAHPSTPRARSTCGTGAR